MMSTSSEGIIKREYLATIDELVRDADVRELDLSSPDVIRIRKSV
jgi:hypothetical protein